MEKHEKEFEYKFHKGDKKHPYKVIEIEIEADKDNLDGKKDISSNDVHVHLQLQSIGFKRVDYAYWSRS